MKLRNKKEYEIFKWSKVIYRALIKSSRGLLVPIKTFKTTNQDSFISIRSKTKSKIILDGLKENYLMRLDNKIITRVIPIHSVPIFLNEISFQLKRNNINNIIIYNEFVLA